MDDGSPIGYILAIILLILGGAYFAATEIAMASVNRIRMMSYADDGNKRAKRVLYILDHFDKALTTLLIGNNIMHIACASIATVMANRLWGVDAVTATTFVVTFVVFLFAEMLPKRIAKACSERYALSAAGSLLFLMRALSPLSFVFSKLSAWIGKPFRHVEEPTVTEDELYDIIENISNVSAIDDETTELVQSALEFSDTKVHEALTPWNRVVTVSTAMGNDEALRVIQENVHSRLPVVDGEGNVIGMLQIRRYLKACLANPGLRPEEAMDDVHFVSDALAIDDLLTDMSRHKTHFSVVLDRNGATLGIITVEDILEELVGEIYDEDDKEEELL